MVLKLQLIIVWRGYPISVKVDGQNVFARLSDDNEFKLLNEVELDYLAGIESQLRNSDDYEMETSETDGVKTSKYRWIRTLKVADATKPFDFILKSDSD